MPATAASGGNPEIRSARRRRTTLLILAFLAWLLFYWLAEAAHAGERQDIDELLRATVHRHSAPALTWLMRCITQLGSVWVLIPSAVAAVVLLFLRKWNRAATLLLIDMLAVPWLNEYLKISFHRHRPEAFFGITPADYSFPSAHSLASFCFYGMLAALLSTRIQRREKRTALWVAGVSAILLVGLSRVYLGVHYPSDVIGGWSAALVWVSVLLVFDQSDSVPKST